MAAVKAPRKGGYNTDLRRQNDALISQLDNRKKQITGLENDIFMYREEIGSLNRELAKHRIGSFLLGAGFAFVVSYLVTLL